MLRYSFPSVSAAEARMVGRFNGLERTDREAVFDPPTAAEGLSMLLDYVVYVIHSVSFGSVRTVAFETPVPTLLFDIHSTD
ncbi:hypothetical protein R1flu_009609 [Riccia fluitans]|uniref:Uncharacterized protein n=1 Tax=Riccia fluitans TaxID=41844 RepID=A0ABD1Z5L9_9MARC